MGHAPTSRSRLIGPAAGASMGDGTEATAAELQAAILNLAAVIETETKRWHDATTAYLRWGLTPEQKAKIKALLDDANTVRRRRVEEIRHLADQCPTDVRAKLYHSAIKLTTSSGDGVPELLAEAAAVIRNGESDAADTKDAGDKSAAEHWSSPMSKAEMARRITGKRKSRAREIEGLLTEHGVKQVSRKKWCIRLDKMDPHTRSKLEATN